MGEISIDIEEILNTHGLSPVDVIDQDGPAEYPHAFPIINQDTARWIDEQLDWEDAVAIAFLTVQKDDIALQLSRYVVVLLEGRKQNNLLLQML